MIWIWLSTSPCHTTPPFVPDITAVVRFVTNRDLCGLCHTVLHAKSLPLLLIFCQYMNRTKMPCCSYASFTSSSFLSLLVWPFYSLKLTGNKLPVHVEVRKWADWLGCIILTDFNLLLALHYFHFVPLQFAPSIIVPICFRSTRNGTVQCMELTNVQVMMTSENYWDGAISDRTDWNYRFTVRFLIVELRWWFDEIFAT